MERVPDPVSIVAAVDDSSLRLGRIIEQGGRAGIVADLSDRHEQTRRAPIRVGNGMELGFHATFGAADQRAEILL